ncbi:MAG: type II toxin-antitoxin system prevent-host-death family antitoxin [Roseiarcus sp.]
MKTMSALEAKNAFGLMIDSARADLVFIEKRGRGVVMVISVEECERVHNDTETAPNATSATVSRRTVGASKSGRT